MQESFHRQRQRLAILTLIVGATLLGFKFWAYKLTGSEAIFSDAMESIINVFAALVLIRVIRVSVAPPDRNHPYGHGKFEYVLAAFEGGLIAFAALAIVYESVDAILRRETLHELGLGLVIVTGCALVNLILGWTLRQIGRTHRSMAMQSGGAHLISDFFTSLGVAVGVGLVHLTGWSILDPLTAIAFAAVLAWTGFGIFRRAAAGLTDETDGELIESIKKFFVENRRHGIIQMHHLRIIQSGHFHHVDAHLVVPEFWTVGTGHEATSQFAGDLIRTYPYDGDVAFHLDPCRRAYCAHCDLRDCSVREAVFREHLPVDAETLTDPEEPLRKRT
jgi:cation diffusion facilitator family transporter